MLVYLQPFPGAISHGTLDKSPESYPQGLAPATNSPGKYPITAGRLLVAGFSSTCMPGINLHLSRRSAYLNNRRYTVAFYGGYDVTGPGITRRNS